tara:strand:- start:748 stop:1305 length:558 start_codon:yes stop_codon:yes gene_type:complete
MAKRRLETVKSFFEAGDKPGQDEFAHLIDSVYQTEVSRPTTLGADTSATSTLIRDLEGNSGIEIPAGALITNMFIVCTTEITLASSGDCGYKIGKNSSASQALVTAQTAGLINSGTTLTVGKGVAMDEKMNTALAGPQIIVPVVAGTSNGQMYFPSGDKIFCTITSTQNQTAGQVVFGIQYVKIT